MPMSESVRPQRAGLKVDELTSVTIYGRHSNVTAKACLQSEAHYCEHDSPVAFILNHLVLSRPRNVQNITQA
jgi:hypothetical protein